MQTGVFIFFTALILSVTTWLDAFFSTLGIKKAIANMYLLAIVVLNPFTIEISSEISINPAVITAVSGLFFASLRKKQFNAFLYVLSVIVFSFLCLLTAYSLPNIGVLLPSCFLSVLLSLLFYKKQPLFSALVVVTLPVAFYFATVGLEILYFVPFKSIDVQSCLKLQAILLTASLLTSFLCLELSKKRKLSLNSEKN